MGVSPGQISQFPMGFINGVTIRGTPILQTQSGNTFWVSNVAADATKLRGQSQGSNNNRGDFNHPFATLAYALTQTQPKDNVPGSGDVIYIKPGHVETLGGVGVLTQSSAGVSVIGLGTYNTRPKFIMGTAATTTYLVSGANSYISNLWMVGNFANVTSCFNVTATGCTIDNIRFSNNAASVDFLNPVNCLGAANTADGLTVSNCNWSTIETGDFGLVNIAAAAKDVTIWNNHVVNAGANASAGSCSNLLNCVSGAVLLNANIGWNRVWNAMTAGEVLISNDGTTNTGIVHNNYVQCQDTTTTIDMGSDLGGFGNFENYCVTTNALSGFLNPAADVNL